MDDKKLIQNSLQGDEKSFEVLVNNHLVYWQQFAKKNFRISHSDLQDAIQNTRVKIFRYLKSFKFESTFITWSCRILSNEIYTILERNKNRQSKVLLYNDFVSSDGIRENKDAFLNFGDYVEDPKVYSNDEDRFNKKLLKLTLSKLDKKSSEVIKLALEEEKSYQEISQILHIPIGSVMSRLFWARKRAQKLIAIFQNRFERSELV